MYEVLPKVSEDLLPLDLDVARQLPAAVAKVGQHQ